MQKPKVICTIGPTSLNEDVLRKLKSRGVNYFRINLSHTPLDKIEEVVTELKKYGVPVILDTEGSQIRTGNSNEINIKSGQEIKVYADEIQCNQNNLFLTPKGIVRHFKIGDLIEIDFNSTLLSVSDTSKLNSEGYITCRCLIGGIIGGKKGVHLDSGIYLPPFSQKDYQAFEIGKKHGITTFTLSFIRKKQDVLEFKKIYPEATIYSKIETAEAVKNIDSILELSNGILIDRGDLSREIPLEKIPLTQKYLINKAREKEKLVFVATNTLEKMANSLKPDKSEANDVINTILDGASGIALTKETATGNYPVETVNTLLTLFDQLFFLENIVPQCKIAKNLDKTDFFESKEGFLQKPHGGKLVNRFLKTPLSEEQMDSLKILEVNDEVLMDAEQIAIGAFSPLEGFLDSKNLDSVLNTMRLSNGTIWPLPVILQIEQDKISDFHEDEDILLISKKDKTPYAILHLSEIYKLNKQEFAEKVFGTQSLEHPGVSNLMNSGDYSLGGKISLIKRTKSHYKLYELTPSQTRKIFSEKGWKKVVGFHTRNVIHKSHEFIQLDSIKKGACDGLFVHPIIGKKKKGDFETELIIKSYEKMERDFYPTGKVIFSTFQSYSRYAGPREAIFTALVRKNFGCSHFIVGRDHTGVKDFYHPNASHNIFNQFPQEELGIIPIKFDNVFYSNTHQKHLHESEAPDHLENEKLHLSGTQARELFKKQECPPEWFMRPEISQLILEQIQQGKPVFVN